MLRQSIGKYGTDGNSSVVGGRVNVCINFNTFRLYEMNSFFPVCVCVCRVPVQKKNERKTAERKTKLVTKSVARLELYTVAFCLALSIIAIGHE